MSSVGRPLTLAQPRAQAPSPETPRRASIKRTYNNMDDSVSETSEYVPAEQGRKGKKRARPANVRSDPVESSSAAGERKRKKRQRRDSAAGDDLPTGAKEDLEALVDLEVPSTDVAAHVQHARRSRYSKRPESTTELLARLHAENTKLEAQLANCANDVKKTQLDSLLRADGDEKKFQELNRKYRRLQGLYSEKTQFLDEKAVQIVQLETALKGAKDSVQNLRHTTSSLMSQISKHDREILGYEDALKTAQEDVEALRRIEVDVRAEQERAEERYNTLPPAYGSLPEPADAGDLPEEAVDSGVLTIANLKHTVRTEFMANVKMFRKMQDNLRNKAVGSVEHNKADGAYIRGIHEAFGDACRNVGAVLDRAMLTVSDVIPVVGSEGGNKQNQDFTIVGALLKGMQKTNVRHGFIADRVAKLLLDIALRLVSALELRPLFVGAAFGYDEKNEIALVWSSFDATLSKSLRRLFNVSESSTSSQVVETCIQLQTFLAQVKSLQEVMGSVRIRTGVGYYGPLARHGEGKYLCETSEWLIDQLEAWRSIAAKTADEEALAMAEAERASQVPATISPTLREPLTASMPAGQAAAADYSSRIHAPARRIYPWTVHETVAGPIENEIARQEALQRNAEQDHNSASARPSPTRSTSVVRDMITAAQARLHHTPHRQHSEDVEVSSDDTPHNSDDDLDELPPDGSVVDPIHERGSRRALARRCSRLRSSAQQGWNRRPRPVTPMDTHDEAMESESEDLGSSVFDTLPSSDVDFEEAVSRLSDGEDA